MNKENRNSTPFSMENLQDLCGSGTLQLEDVRKMYEIMKREQILSRYTFPTQMSSDEYYHIWVDDPTKTNGRKQLKAKSLDELKNKVYLHEKSIYGEAPKTFFDVFEIVQNEKLRYIKNEEKRLSVKNTIERNRSEYARFFKDTNFEQMLIDDISKKDVENICIRNLEKYNLRSKGFLSMRSILKSVFNLAYEEYWISDNLYDRIDFNKFKDMLIPEVPVEQRVHTDAEIERMLCYIHEKQEKRPNYFGAYALELQMLMGLRRGEVPALMWSDITENYILINKEQITVKKSETVPKEYFVIVNHTKTYKDRKFPVTGKVEELLCRIRAVHERLRLDSPYLFPADNECGVITNNVVYNFYRRMCRSLQIPVDSECIKGTHSFRRNAITKVVNQSGGNIFMASQLFGNSPEVAKNNYYTGLNLTEAKTVLELQQFGNQAVTKL